VENVIKLFLHKYLNDHKEILEWNFRNRYFYWRNRLSSILIIRL